MSELRVLDPNAATIVADLIDDELLLTPTQLAEFCRRLSISKISFTFSGGSDQGGAESCALIYEDDTTSELRLYDTPAPFDEITDLIDSMLEQHWGHFDGEPDVQGEGTFDAVTAEWTLNGSESVQEWEQFTHTYSGDQLPVIEEYDYLMPTIINPEDPTP